MSESSPFELTEVIDLPVGKPIETSLDKRILEQTQVELNVHLGDVSVSISELKELKVNSIIQLAQRVDSEFELKWQDVVVAKGRLVAVEEHLALEITQVMPNEE
ncbi:FliM/FliN family flagellar motor C-terminal domain-containing protein [Shewanella woodyi]|uniref:FliM/FliN family flagellar motor C-terminal domain-containing protein n=1 Tax=Shewanella woodyi TaxID=60961 RepID=UPI003747ECF7